MRWGWMTLVALVCVAGCSQPSVQKGDALSTGSDKHATVTITVDNFDKEVLQSDKPVLLDFWAVWCGPCKMIAPAVEELAVELKGETKVGKVDVDTQEAIAQKYNVNAYPTLLVFKNGEVVGRQEGVPRGDVKAALIDLIKRGS